MRLLVLSDSFNGYGAEHILKWLGNGLCDSGFEVSFCSIFDQGRDKGLTDRAHYYEMRFPKEVYDISYFLKGMIYLRKLKKKDNFDCILTFHTNPYLMALLAKPFSGIKTIHSERDNPYNRNTLATKFKMWTYRYAQKIVFQTEGARAFFDQGIKDKSVIIPNPISIPKACWRGEGAHTIASVGRLFIRFKRQDVLLEAFNRVLESYPNYKLVLYGDGPDSEKIKRIVASLGIKDHVCFKGKVSNVMDCLIDEEIFVLSSDSEGMPNALMEAMALGMPVVSTDCEPGGAKALIDNGVNGLLVSRSSVDELAAALVVNYADVLLAADSAGIDTVNDTAECKRIFAAEFQFDR